MTSESIPECEAYAETLHRCLGIDPASFELSASALAASPRSIDPAERARLSAACSRDTARAQRACR